MLLEVIKRFWMRDDGFPRERTDANLVDQCSMAIKFKIKAVGVDQVWQTVQIPLLLLKIVILQSRYIDCDVFCFTMTVDEINGREFVVTTNVASF